MMDWGTVFFRVAAVFFSVGAMIDTSLRHLPIVGEPWSLMRTIPLAIVFAAAALFGWVVWDAVDPFRRKEQRPA